MNQRRLFPDAKVDRTYGVEYAGQAPTEDRPRLSRQCQAILARLQRGPATNAELAAIALKYTGRVSDLRAAGNAIECTRLEAGLTLYRLETKQ